MNYCSNHGIKQNLKSIRGLGYIQSSPVFFILPHMYSCPPAEMKNKPNYNVLNRDSLSDELYCSLRDIKNGRLKFICKRSNKSYNSTFTNHVTVLKKHSLLI